MIECNRCGETKPKSEFYRRKQGGGLVRPCKECMRAAARAHHAANREAANARFRKWWAANREGQTARLRRKYHANREHFRARARRWGRANPEKRRAKAARYRAEHVAEAREAVRARRRHMRRASRSTLRFRDVLGGDPCSYCGAPAETVDHIEPLALGGANHWSNMAAACVSCNGSKRATPLLHFLARDRA